MSRQDKTMMRRFETRFKQSQLNCHWVSIRRKKRCKFVSKRGRWYSGRCDSRYRRKNPRQPNRVERLNWDFSSVSIEWVNSTRVIYIFCACFFLLFFIELHIYHYLVPHRVRFTYLDRCKKEKCAETWVHSFVLYVSLIILWLAYFYTCKTAQWFSFFLVIPHLLFFLTLIWTLSNFF